MLSTVITAEGRPVEGQRYTLTCAVSGDDLLAPTNRRFQWDKGSSIGKNNATLTFNPIRPDDTGDYRCTVSFDSPYLTGTQRVTETVRVAVLGLVKNLEVTADPTATTLAIAWTVSGSIDRIEVSYNYIVNRCSSRGTSRTDHLSVGSVSYTLSGLNEDSNYTITVRAINAAEFTMSTIAANTLTSGRLSIFTN